MDTESNLSTPGRYNRLKSLEAQKQVTVSLVDSEGDVLYTVTETDADLAIRKALTVKEEHNLVNWRLEIAEQ